MSSVKSSEEACDNAKNLKKDPGNDAKLNKQATFKQADTSKNYISLACKLRIDGEKQNETAVQKSDQKYECLDYSVIDDITIIKFNRPKKKNAMSTQMYEDIISALKEASENETAIAILTGEGDYFSSGNDLNNFTKYLGDDISTAAKNAAQMFKKFVETFIDFPKILVAAVNGPALGISVTLLGLCDVVYASDKATFQTPFTLLGQLPEACSSYTFPKIMGYTKANEILIFNKKFTAAEAKATGLVTEVFTHNNFSTEILNRMALLSTVSKQSMIMSKELIRKTDKEILHKVNDAECEKMVERWQSQDFMEAIMRYFHRKTSKL